MLSILGVYRGGPAPKGFQRVSLMWSKCPKAVLWPPVSAHGCTVTPFVYPWLYCDPLCLPIAVLWPPLSTHVCTVAPSVCPWLYCEPLSLPMAVLWTHVSTHGCTVNPCVYPWLYCDPMGLPIAVPWPLWTLMSVSVFVSPHALGHLRTNHTFTLLSHHAAIRGIV